MLAYALDNSRALGGCLIILGAAIGLLGGIGCWIWCYQKGADLISFIVAHFGAIGAIFVGIVLYALGCRVIGVPLRTGNNGKILHFLSNEWFTIFLAVFILSVAAWWLEQFLKSQHQRVVRNPALAANVVQGGWHVVTTLGLSVVFLGMLTQAFF